MSGNDFLGAFYEKPQKPGGFSWFRGAPGSLDLKTWIASEPESTMHVDSRTASWYHSGRTSSWRHAAQAKGNGVDLQDQRRKIHNL